MNLPTVKTEIQVRFSDLDILGHVSNSIYGQYLELGRIQWFNQIPGKSIPVVVVNLTINYLGEVKLEDKVHVMTYCIKVGNTSAQLGQDVYANGRCVTKATAVVVGFDTEARKAVPLLTGWQPSIVEPE